MSVRRSIAWAYLGQFASFVITFVGSVIVARLLSPHELGVFAIAAAAQGVIQAIATVGLGAYIVRDPDLQPGTVDTTFTVNALLAVLLAFILFALSYAAAWLLGDPDAGQVLRLMAVGPFLGIFSFRPAVMLQREMRFKTITLINAANASVIATATVAAALLGASFMSPAFGLLTGGLVTTIVFNLVASQHVSLRMSLKGWRTVTAFGVRIMSISGVSVLCARLAEVILGRVLGLAALGLYARASNVSNMIFENVYGTATKVLFAKLSKDQREKGEIRSTFLRGLQLITAVVWPLLLVLGLVAKPLFLVLYGEQWIAAATPFSLLMVFLFLVLCFGMNWELFVLKDETARQTRLEVTRAFLGLAAFAFLCRFGLAWAAVGRIVDGLVGLVLYAPHVKRLSGAAPWEIGGIFLRSAGLALAAGLPSLGVMIAFDWSARTPLAWLAAAVATGAVLWLITAALLRHPVIDEIRLLARRTPLVRKTFLARL